MSNPYQHGATPFRLEWVEESSEGTTPSDPSWNLFSDNVTQAWGWEPDANTQRQDAVGAATAQGFYNGNETHEISFSWDMQQWFEDGSGDPLDPGYYWLEPDADNKLRNTLTIVSRSEQSSGGVDGSGFRTYTVAKGCHPDELTIPFETEDGSPVNLEGSLQAEKVRQYQIDQPADSTTVDITNNGSNSVDVTVEDEGASTAETNTVSGGGTTVTTTATFGDIDAVELSTDVDGNVLIEDDSSNTLLDIKGSDSYPAGEGDLGIPALGSGSHASALNSNYISFVDDTLSVPNMESDIEIISGEATASTGLDSNSVEGTTARPNIHSTTWTYEVTATLAGTRMSVDSAQNYLQENTGEITWGESSDSAHNLDFNNAFLQSPGEYSKEAGDGKLTMDNTFEAESVAVDN